MLKSAYYAQNYASIIYQGLTVSLAGLSSLVRICSLYLQQQIWHNSPITILYVCTSLVPRPRPLTRRWIKSGLVHALWQCMSLGLDRLCSNPCLLFYSLIPKVLTYYAFRFTYYAFFMLPISPQKLYIPQLKTWTELKTWVTRHILQKR